MSPPCSGTVRIGYVRALLDHLQLHQLDTEAIFDAGLIHALNHTSLNERIPLSRWGDLLNRAIAHTGDSALPLNVAETLTPTHWGVFAYAAMSCENLAQVVQILNRYERLIDEANDTRIVIEGERGVLQWLPRPGNTIVPAFMQISLASWCLFARRYTGMPQLQADADFTFPAPENVSTYQRIFKGVVRFDQPVTQLLFPLTYLQLPITYHDADTHRVMMQQVHTQLEALDAEQDIVGLVRHTLSQQLSSGRVTLECVAERLTLPPRALQYQLEQNGTSFRELLDDVRKEMACYYLQDPNLALVDVAFLLGYAEQSPFNKAFKRWQGETPGEYRKRLTG